MKGMAVVAVAAMIGFVASTSHAYSFRGPGAGIGATSPEDMGGTVLVSGHLEFVNDSRVHLVPNVQYWKADRRSDLNPNFDVTYHFLPESETTPYVGGGLGVNMRRSDITNRSDSDLGANVIGGVRFPGSSNNYFLEGRYTASDIPEVSVKAGITFWNR
jgi:hypothetical protein